MRCQLKVWFARVSIGSNAADRSSRLDVTELVAEGASRVIVNWDKPLEQIQKNIDLISEVTVERDRTFPAALLRKRCAPNLTYAEFFPSEGLTVDMFYPIMRKDCFGSRRDTKRFWWRFFNDWVFCKTKNVQRRNHERNFLRVVDMDIRMCIYI